MESSTKKVLIAGFSVTGIACAKYLSKDYDVYLSEYSSLKDEDKDKAQELKELGVKLEFGGHSDEFINNSSFAILSPSIPLDAPILKRLSEKIYPIFPIWISFIEQHQARIFQKLF